MKSKNQNLSIRTTLIYLICMIISITCSSLLLAMLYKTGFIQHSNVLMDKWINILPSTLLLLWAIFIIKFQNKRCTNYQFLLVDIC